MSVKDHQLQVDPRWGIRCDALMAAQLELAEEAFVTGEKFDQRADGSFLRLYPPLDRVAVQFQIPQKILADIAARNGWEEQRRRFHEKVRDEVRSAQARVRAVSHQEMLEGIDGAIRKFLEKVDNDKIHMDTMADLDKAIRLKEFLLGNSESKKETKLVISLAEMQARYRAARIDDSLMTAEIAGQLAAGEAAQDVDGIDGVVDAEGG